MLAGFGRDLAAILDDADLAGFHMGSVPRTVVVMHRRF